MKLSGTAVKPAGEIRWTRGRDEEKSSFSQSGSERGYDGHRPAPGAVKQRTDSVSFSELMRQCRQGESDAAKNGYNAEISLFLDLAERSNERIRQMALADPQPPVTGAMFWVPLLGTGFLNFMTEEPPWL